MTHTLIALACLSLFGAALHAASNANNTSKTKGQPLYPTFAKAQTISADFVGFNGNMLPACPAPWSKPHINQAVKALGTRTLRYPAGTLANTWDWDKGKLFRDIPDKYMIRWVKGAGVHKRELKYDMKNLYEGYKATGFMPVYVVNMLCYPGEDKDARLDMTIRNLKKAKALGLPIQYIELGNEYYFDIPLEKLNFPTPEDYGRECDRWIKALKPLFPEAKFAVVGGGPVRTPRNRNWTTRVLSTCKLADAITVHAYTPSGIFGIDTDDAFKIEDEGKILEPEAIKNLSPEAKAKVAMRRLAKPEGFADMMASGYGFLDRKLAKTGVPDGLPLWVTEWHLSKTEKVINQTWGAALFIALSYDNILRVDRVELSHIHNVLGKTFPVLLPDENGTLQQAAAGIVSNHLSQVIGDRTAATRITFPGAQPLVSKIGSVPSLIGWKFGEGEQSTAMLINLNSSPSTIHTGTLPTGKATQFSMAPTATPVLTDGKSVNIDATSATLPPYSITFVK